MPKVGFEEFSFPLPGPHDDLEKDLKSAGYSLMSRLGSESATVYVEIWQPKTGQEFLFLVITPTRCYSILVDDFVDMLAFMKEFLPMIERIGRLDKLREEEDEENRRLNQKRAAILREKDPAKKIVSD